MSGRNLRRECCRCQSVCERLRDGSSRNRPPVMVPLWRATGRVTGNRREPNWGEFAGQVIPGLPLSQTSDGNYVASEVVPCVFLAAPHPQRHITPSATEEICSGPHKFSQPQETPAPPSLPTVPANGSVWTHRRPFLPQGIFLYPPACCSPSWR
jgi:hypothetical protein